MEGVMTINTGQITVRRVLFAAIGVISVALAIIGVFVPGLPTTVFVIAASYCFTRSSPALQGWLEHNRWLGPSLRRFGETRGMPRKAKVAALISMWAGISVSVAALAAIGAVAQLLVVSLGVVGTATILFVVRTTAGRQPLILS
jgi:uncharacterized protein